MYLFFWHYFQPGRKFKAIVQLQPNVDLCKFAFKMQIYITYDTPSSYTPQSCLIYLGNQHFQTENGALLPWREAFLGAGPL